MAGFPPNPVQAFAGKLHPSTRRAEDARMGNQRCCGREDVQYPNVCARLLDREYDLSGLLHVAQDLARRLFKAESVEGGLTIDPATGLPKGITGKITCVNRLQRSGIRASSPPTACSRTRTQRWKAPVCRSRCS